MATTIWHNPRCSKSRQTLALLERNGIQPTVRLYLEDPPTKAELAAVVKMLGGKARALLRDAEPDFAKLGLSDPKKSDAQIVDAMASHPVLIQRPVVIHGPKAAIGRPPENVLEMLRVTLLCHK